MSARLASGDVATARTMLEALRASSANPLAVDYLSVLTYVAAKDNAKATALAERLAGENAGTTWAHLLLATVYLDGGRRSQAREEFDQVLKLEPSNKEVVLKLAELDFQDGDADSGKKRLGGLIEADPKDFRPHQLLAYWLLGQGRLGDALGEARQAVTLAPDSLAALNLLGRVAALSGRWDEAQKSYDRITTLDPLNARAWAYLARAIVAGGHKGPPDSLRKALEIAPLDPVVLVTAGDIMMDAQQTERAIEYFEHAYAAEPSGELATRICHARTVAGKPAACEALSSWLTKNPRDMEARLYMALVHQSRRESKLAIAEYEIALGQDPRQPRALNNLAWLYFEQGDKRALAIAERAFEVQPESAPVMDTLGWIQVQGGDKRRGLNLISSAAKATPNDADIQYHLAFAQAENGDIAQARKTLSAVLAAAPKFPSRGDAEGLMRRLDQAPPGAGG